MKIGIDISQLAYQNTGVANYLKHLLEKIVEDDSNTYVLFFSTLRGSINKNDLPQGKNITFKRFYLPPSLLDLLWNKLHIIPIERFVGDVDVFITSDWTEPPALRAKKVTIVYDLIVYRHPEESTEKIVSTQKRKLEWVKKESSAILCISESTKRDVFDVLKIPLSLLHVVYPGIN